MRILITGADGFIGKNMRAELRNRNYSEVMEFNDFNNIDLLKQCVEQSDFIFHFQTLYRSDDRKAFEQINYGHTQKIVESAASGGKSVLLLSSIQAGNSSAYGQSKLHAEECILKWAEATGNRAYIYRIANEFGKWCPPSLNSVVATFCHNIANEEKITVNNAAAPLHLMYIDDIVSSFINTMESGHVGGFCDVTPVYDTTLGEVAQMIRAFSLSRETLDIPEAGNELVKKLYSTYLSYLPRDRFAYPLVTHSDDRGSFTEMLHFGANGQVSVNVVKPGVTKGNHWHNTKTEKFIVVSGEGRIKFRQVFSDEITEYIVNGDKIEVVDIPPGYTHSITNIGNTEMITIMWANEVFDPEIPDTYYVEV